jgi:hypothetical protein
MWVHYMLNNSDNPYVDFEPCAHQEFPFGENPLVLEKIADDHYKIAEKTEGFLNNTDPDFASAIIFISYGMPVQNGLTIEKIRGMQQTDAEVTERCLRLSEGFPKTTDKASRELMSVLRKVVRYFQDYANDPSTTDDELWNGMLLFLIAAYEIGTEELWALYTMPDRRRYED